MVKNDIVFTGVCGSENWNIVLTQPSGGALGYYIMINNYYRGTLSLQNGEWTWLNCPSDFAGGDVAELVSRVLNETKFFL